MRILILFSLLALGVAATAVYRIPLKKNPSLKQTLIYNGKWKEYHAMKQARRLLAKAKEYAQPIGDFDDEMYSMNITIGTPPQPFQVLLSLNTGDLWVPDASCGTPAPECQAFGCDLSQFCSLLCPQPSCCDRTKPPPGNPMCQGKHRFNQSLSSSINPLDDPLIIRYTNSLMMGSINLDTLAFGDVDSHPLTVPNTAVCFAQLVPQFLEFLPVDGIIGFGPLDSAQGGFNPPILNAVSQGLIESLFTVFLAYDSGVMSNRGGVLTYGGIDNENCGDVMFNTPFTSVSDYRYQVRSIQAGKLSFNGNYQTISETADTALTLPSSIADALVEYFGGTYDVNSGLTLIDCKAVNTIPEITIQIGTNQLTISPANMILPFIDGQCLLAIQSNDAVGFAPEVILGEPFMRSYCHVFKINSLQLGFAKPLQRN